jgi:hypothetical protein
MSESENETKGFKVTDRRKFMEDGEPRPEADASSDKKTPLEEEPAGKETEPRKSSATKEEPESTEPKVGPPPDVRFLDLVNMLATHAFVQLGDVVDPTSGERAENLQGAQVMIGFLTLMQEKTKGNLDKEEEKFLEEMLYNLRMRFLTKANLIKH